MTYVSPADAARQIRARLKAAGVPARAVSVRSESFSMGSAIRLRILDLSVPYAVVVAASSPEEKIDRDGYGEILSGANRYVDLSIDSDAIKAAAALVEAMPENERGYCGRRFYRCDVGTDHESIVVEGHTYGRNPDTLEGAVRSAYMLGPIPTVLKAGPVDAAALAAIFDDADDVATLAAAEIEAVAN